MKGKCINCDEECDSIKMAKIKIDVERDKSSLNIEIEVPICDDCTDENLSEISEGIVEFKKEMTERDLDIKLIKASVDLNLS